MPAHAVLGMVTLLLSVLAALTSLLYAVVPRVRAATRWSVVGLAALSLAGAAVAGEAAKALLDAVESVGAPAEVAAAQAHGHGSDALTASVFFLLLATLTTVWGPLRPARPAGRAARWWAGVLVVLAVATLVSAAVVLGDALQAVTAGNPAWQEG